jgi:hypothetical protein
MTGGDWPGSQSPNEQRGRATGIARPPNEDKSSKHVISKEVLAEFRAKINSGSDPA